jgi:hypothetical protein
VYFSTIPPFLVEVSKMDKETKLFDLGEDILYLILKQARTLLPSLFKEQTNSIDPKLFPSFS